ncbi:MAG: NFACT family protein [Oscillospiraceae bacterium]|nr:NFACT family protein [Oscillospiraceae bacterium]
MPLDSITVSALAAELRSGLENARIDKIQQPARDTVLLSLRTAGGNRRLLLCGGPGEARLHFTSSRFENPEQPPMFCMLLRKHLGGARIVGVEQPERERAVVLSLLGRDELGVEAPKKIVVEMVGRGANLILVDGEGIIIDCLRRVDFDMSAARQVLPGLRYRLPPRPPKPDFLDVPPAERRALWERREKGTEAAKWLLDSFAGLSPLLCRELAHRCGGAEDNLPAVMDAFAESVLAGEFSPWMLLSGGQPKDFSFLPVSQYGAAVERERFPDFSSLLDAFYTRRGQAEEMRRKTSALRRTVKNARDRALRKYAAQTEELKQTANREQKRRWGDLITANLYRAPKGRPGSMTVEDFYEEGSPEVAIPLDRRKTPQQNAAAYYKEYTKAKTAEKYLNELLVRTERDADYLQSVLDEIDRAGSEADVAAIRRELTETGYLRQPRGAKKERVRESAPLRYYSTGGYEIWVGRGNVQNDQLTLKLAHKGDLWFHTQKIHGSHVILRCAGAEPDAESLREAAALAATHSQASAGGKVPVDYTRVRFVKKPAGALPGMVIYTNQTTISASADPELEQRLKIR